MRFQTSTAAAAVQPTEGAPFEYTGSIAATTSRPIAYVMSPPAATPDRSRICPDAATAVAAARTKNVMRIVVGVARDDILLRTCVAAK